MSKKASKPQDQTTSDEEKSDEFKNFERAIDRTLSLPKDEVERIKREVPVVKEKPKTRDN